MRAKNRFLTFVLAAMIVAVLAVVARWEHNGVFQKPPEPTPTPVPTVTPIPDSPLRGGVCITELMEKNRTAGTDEDGDFSDWIEIGNLTDRDVSLAGWRIADREDRWGWTFTDCTLRAGERLLVFADRKDRAGDIPHTNFALSEQDVVCLYDAEGAIVDRAPCGGCDNDISMALAADGSWAACTHPTPGFENTDAGYEAYQQTLGAEGPLAVWEVMVANFGVFTAGNSSDLDWVEIKNISDTEVQLSDFFLSDKVSVPFRWQLPEKTLKPGDFLVVVCDNDPEGFYGSVPCTGFALNSTREQIYLTNGEGKRIDSANLFDIPYNGSLGRMDGEGGFFYFTTPTPGAENRDGCRRISAAPVSLTADGIFEGAERVTVTLSGVGTLRYTLDGSAPTENSPAYTEPLTLEKTGVVRARCFEPGCVPSPVLTQSFFLNEGHTLPVVSLVADSPKQFDGMYNAGSKAYELPGAVSLYREGDSFTISCGVSMNGETSLVMAKKNMALRFRGAYGQESLSHDIFGGGATEFTHLLLRAGQDQDQTVIRNELSQNLAAQAGCSFVNQRSIYCALYINGEYSGLYTLKERPNAALYAAVAGVSRDSVEAWEAPVPYGSDFYREIVDFVNKNDMTQEENYRRFCAVMDVDNLIDWIFMEGFCANTDITSGNLRYARSNEADGKWHLLFYDLDATFRSYSSIQTNLLNGYGAKRIQIGAYAVPLMANADFRDRFLTRAADYLRGPLTNEAVLAEIDRLCEEIRPELERDYARFGRDLSLWDRSIRLLRETVCDSDWRQGNIDGLCQSFELTAEERAHYFGDIDGK